MENKINVDKALFVIVLIACMLCGIVLSFTLDKFKYEKDDNTKKIGFDREMSICFDTYDSYSKADDNTRKTAFTNGCFFGCNFYDQALLEKGTLEDYHKGNLDDFDVYREIDKLCSESCWKE